MLSASEEPQGPCPCQGTLCSKGFGWIFAGISDLAGNFHSGRHSVSVCGMFPEELMEWDGEDGMFLPPPPPGMSIETMKGYMNIFRGTDKDLQKASSAAAASELAHERSDRKWGGWEKDE